MEQVSLDDLKEPGGFLGRTGFSLPSEAQWEYACRAGTTGDFAGTGVLGEMGWYKKNSGNETHEVGGKLPNDFGLHDMHGNVAEWCADVYNRDFYGSDSAYGPDPLSTSGYGAGIVRGGHFNFNSLFCRSSFRAPDLPRDRNVNFGFRPARPLP